MVEFLNPAKTGSTVAEPVNNAASAICTEMVSTEEERARACPCVAKRAHAAATLCARFLPRLLQNFSLGFPSKCMCVCVRCMSIVLSQGTPGTPTCAARNVHRKVKTKGSSWCWWWCWLEKAQTRKSLQENNGNNYTRENL